MLGDYVNKLDQNTYRTEEYAGLFMQDTRKEKDDLRLQFTTLLVKQMEAQDPLEPVTNEAFVAQLATFSSLEQLSALNKRIDSMILGQQQLVNSQSMALIGREVLADTGSTVHFDGERTDRMVAQLGAEPAIARLEIKNAAGRTVRTIQLEDMKAGRNELAWDGKDAQGNALPEGDYTFSVVAADSKGVPIAAQGYVGFLVDGIQVGAGGIQLVSGERVVDFSNVIEIKMPAATPTAGN